jgi:excisionase family DNA binding protein
MAIGVATATAYPEFAMNATSFPSAGPQPDETSGTATLLTVVEAARLLRIGRNTCYDLIRQGEIPHVRLGRIIRVPRFGLEAWIARQAGLPVAPPPVVSFSASQRH